MEINAHGQWVVTTRIHRNFRLIDIFIQAEEKKMRKLIALLIGCFALVLASTVRAQIGVNNAELNGDYAFTFNGITGGSGPSSVFAAAGRFTADGAGNLTNGELDNNRVSSGGSVAQAFTGTYAIGADHRGVMTLNIGGGVVNLAFATMANGNAQFIKFDAGRGSGTIGSGTMEKADTTAYSTAKITGDYAFGVAGLDNLNNRAAIAARFTSNGAGILTNSAGNVNAYGTDYPMSFSSATYTVSDTTTGRGTMNLSFSFGGAPASMNFVFYVVNAGKLFAMERDMVTSSTPLLNGVVLRQQVPAGGFSNASLNGNMVIYLTGLSTGCGRVGGIPKAVAGLLTADGNGAFTLTFDENFCSARRSVTGMAGTYSVTSNGRTSIATGGYNLVSYLTNLNQMFLFVADSNVLFGFGEPQAAGSFTNSAVNGRYAGYTTDPVEFGVVVRSGEFTADGASPTGNMTGTEDINTSSGSNPGAAFNATYSISSSQTNGRGTITVTSGAGGNAAIYMISPSKLVAVPLSDPKPAIMVFEQSSPPSTAPNYTLSASPTGLTITQGSNGTSAISVTPQNGFSGSVSLSASGLPSGVTASFSPNPTTTTSTLTLTAGSTTLEPGHPASQGAACTSGTTCMQGWAQWNVYYAESVNGHDTTPFFAQSVISDHVIHRGTISTGSLGGGADRSLADLFQIAFDPQHFANVAFSDDHLVNTEVGPDNGPDNPTSRRKIRANFTHQLAATAGLVVGSGICAGSPPPPPPGAEKITGGGRIPSQKPGLTANFGFVAQNDKPNASLSYHDDGATGGSIDVHSANTSVPTVTFSGNCGTFKGDAKVNQKLGYTYTVNACDNNDPNNGGAGQDNVFHQRNRTKFLLQ
jgi:hypothetical protein